MSWWGSPLSFVITSPIFIGNNVWITADVYIGPGVYISDGVVVMPKSCVTRNIKSWVVVGGNPAVELKKRTFIGWEL